MEMRRSLNANNTVKKARLMSEEAPIIRGNGNGRPVVRAGFRKAVESDVNEGEGYEPQSLSQIKMQQHQELVSQYRTALAELTFNSKPIITNLTIIAGENVQAAKAIANTICNQILEVPSDQKLPSLYLLDSIVKNIGRDYIKHFSAKLPEVFCKAYKQVDPALHSGMRHLFGTWKGVFPPQCLQSIEKELGFQSAGNGSSTGLTTSRAEPQSQRPGGSIHVNPKYLEARQKLQLSSRAKIAASDITTSLINSPDDTGIQDRAAGNLITQRGRADPRLKLQQAQRDAESDLTHENSGGSYNNFDFGSGISSERVAEQAVEKSWYRSGNNSIETMSRLPRNSYDIKHGVSNYPVHRSSIADVKLQQINSFTSNGGGEISRSWKNSDEEEFTWDGVNSASANPTPSNSSKRDPRLYFDPERSGLENNFQKAQRLNDLGTRLRRESLPSLTSKASSLTDEDGRLTGGKKLLNNSGGFSTAFNGVSTNKLVAKAAQSHLGLPNQSPKDSFQTKPQISQVGKTQKSQPHKIQPPSPELPIKHAPFLPPYQPEPVFEPSAQSPIKRSLSAIPSASTSLARPQSLVADIPGPPSSSNLLAAVSSIFANKPISSTSSSSVTNPASNNVSSILSTLVAKGLISTSKDDQRSSGPTLTLSKTQSDDTLPTQEVSPIVASSLLSTPSTSSELIPTKPANKTTVTMPQPIKEDKYFIGFDFRADVIRRFHPTVISDLIDDLPHQCSICGLRFKLQDRFDRHMEWHALKNSESNTSRSWFSNCDNWLNGPSNESILEIDGVQMVTADESQIVCVLCGEMFDDFYSPEGNKWMFKGATYLDITNGQVGNTKNGIIVHVNCVSEHSLSDLGLANDVKVENSL